jgi:hypothetical protein
MARSRGKTPQIGICGTSDKEDKRAARRLERPKVRLVLSARQDVEVLPALKELSDPWRMAKDGKIYWGSRIDQGFKRK